jgi:predicted acylesterase/phospholipase RssA
MALTAEQIASIYAKRRTKGLYQQFLAELLESGENGCDVKETWPQLKDKKATTIKQGFENAKEKKDAPDGSENVDVIVDGEEVYLINSAMVRDLAEATA